MSARRRTPAEEELESRRPSPCKAFEGHGRLLGSPPPWDTKAWPCIDLSTEQRALSNGSQHGCYGEPNLRQEANVLSIALGSHRTLAGLIALQLSGACKPANSSPHPNPRILLEINGVVQRGHDSSPLQALPMNLWEAHLNPLGDIAGGHVVVGAALHVERFHLVTVTRRSQERQDKRAQRCGSQMSLIILGMKKHE